MRAVAISLDGVLRKPLDVEAQDMGGSFLFASLVENFRVVVLGSEDPARDEHFLMVNGLLRYVKIEPLRPEDGRTEAERKRAQLKRLRAEGFQFEFVVVPDPGLARFLYASGFPTLLYLHPVYSTESFRPDHEGGIRAWNELASEVEFQLTTRAQQQMKEATL
jgi:hypothetical protein